MDIGEIRDTDELDEVLRFVLSILPQLDNDEYRYSRDFWIEQLSETPALLLIARVGSALHGSVFGCVENNGVTVGHCCVDEAHRGHGVATALMAEIERRARDLGCKRITLGAAEGAEGFYAKLGYTGALLIQSEQHTIDELRSFNRKYEVIGTNVYDGTVSQVWLRLPLVDRDFQKAYEEGLSGCNTHVTFGKDL
mgnify:FL=1|jgi:GNAT superfamily N-acetyltransferase